MSQPTRFWSVLIETRSTMAGFIIFGIVSKKVINILLLLSFRCDYGKMAFKESPSLPF